MLTQNRYQCTVTLLSPRFFLVEFLTSLPKKVFAESRLFIFLIVLALAPGALFWSGNVSAEVVYRVNSGGVLVSAAPDWGTDTKGNPSTFVNAAATGNKAFSTGSAIDLNDPSIPAGTPEAIFQSERWDPSAAPEMQWDFPVTPGNYEVRLYFADIYSGTNSVGARVFDVSIEGALVLENYDIFADVGGFTGVMKSFVVISDDNLDIDFGHGIDNPAIKGIEIIQAGAGDLGVSPGNVDFGTIVLGNNAVQAVELTNLGSAGDPDIVVSGAQIIGPDATEFSHDFSPSVTLAPGESMTVMAGFDPTNQTGSKSASLEFTHDGNASPLAVVLTGNATEAGSGSMVVYRVNSGGGLVSATPDWATDTKGNPSNFVNAAASGNKTFSTASAIDLSDPSIPAGTPEAIFQSERWDPSAAPEMQWNFPVTPGSYEVRLYFADLFSGTHAVGARVFDVTIEGALVLDNYDIFADVGGFAGVMQSFVVASDSNLDIDFGHVVENPALKGIEIIQLGSGNLSVLTATPTRVGFGDVVVGNNGSQAVQLTNAGTAGDPDIVVSEALITGVNFGDFSEDFIPSVILGPGESTTVNVDFFAENPTGGKSAHLEFTYDSSVLSVALTGNVIAPGDSSAVVYRVNSGGGLVSANPDWEIDTLANPSSFVNAAATGNKTFSTGSTIDLSDPSIPAGTPEAIFQSERWDPSAAPEMQWNFPVTPGSYEVRLYFADLFLGTNAVGARVFDVSVEGTVVLDDYDIFADVGGFAGVMQSFVVTSDSNLDIDFGHVVENPALKGIEIIQLGSGWQQAASLPIALGEVAAGFIGNTMYLVGEGAGVSVNEDDTFAYDVASDTWAPLGSVRPFTGHHHAAEVVNGNLYLIGGLGRSSEGRVQIYDPIGNTWTEGARAPFRSGSGTSAVIGGEIYYAGGIINSATVNQVSAYDPVNDRWSGLLAPMPQGVNHAAAATDGTKLYVFGGRDGGNVVSNGFDYLQIYDPATDSWVSSEDNGSTLAPLPQARGGMGKAVFFNNEFYVFGGETQTGAGATANDVYDRVDIYNPTTNTWRLGDSMPTARHGIFPLLHTGQIYVAGGGVKKGNSQSTIFEVYDLN